jgi:hypothetical protein
MSRPLPYVKGLRKEPKHVRGDILLDDEYSRLYIVLSSRWCNELAYNQYRVLIVADWSIEEDPSSPGEILDFGEGIHDDALVGHVELPANM